VFKKAKPLKDPTDAKHGYEYAMFLLGLRLRTEGEMRTKMQERGYDGEVIEKVIRQLVEQSYVDDDRLVVNLIDSFKKYKNYGFYKIKTKLLAKRLSTSLIEQVLEEHFTLEDESLVAKRWLAREYSSYTMTADTISFEQKQTVAQKLKARGFRMDVIAKLVLKR
jgi:regulatory protein